MTQFIDLSIPITNDVVSDPPVMRPQITYMTHENTWEQIAMFFPGLTRAKTSPMAKAGRSKA
jgi:hypothetical protein